MKKLISLISILIIILCSGCTKNNSSNGLETGFDNIESNDELPSDYCAYKSDKNEFNINEVTLTFYFGGLFSRNIDEEHQNGRNIPYIKLYFLDEDSNQYFVKQVVEYISEKYRCKWVLDNEGNVIRIEFNHSEQITIPKELFSKQSGKVTFSIWGQDIRERESVGRYLASVRLYYKGNNDKVVLSTGPF